MKIHETNFAILKLISSLSGYMHDFGKANKLFQSKIRGTDQLADIVRHEFLSFYIILKLILIYEKEFLIDKNSKFISQQKWNNIFNDLNNIKIDSSINSSTKNILSIQDNDYYYFKINEEIHPITLCVLLAVLTHHKLPCSIKDTQNLQTSFDSLMEYNNLNRTYNLSKEDFIKLKKNLQLHSNYYIDISLEDNINNGFTKIYTDYAYLKSKDTDKAQFFKSFSILSRIFLIMSDHHVSSQQKRILSIEKNNKLTYANTNRDFNDPKSIPTFNQTLDEHLFEVGQTTSSFLDEFLLMQENLPVLNTETITNIMSTSLHQDFQWQDEAVRFIQNLDNKVTLVLNMGTTGSGKTRMNVKALGALNSTNLRITSVFNLKSLTLQTGDAYKNQLKLKNNELSILIGDQNYIDIQTLNDKEEFKIDNDLQSTEEEYFIDGGFNASRDWNKIPTFIKNKKQNGYKVDDFIGVPVLTSTIDFCISAGDLSKGSNHNNAFLRIMSSDLIIDEIDSYEPSMLESVLRLITISAMNKRNIVISSATLSQNYIVMIKKAFEHGIELGNILYGSHDSGKIICISNLTQPAIIQNESDINSYIQNLCDKFSTNKQKKASIIDIDPPISSQKNNIPPIFSTIKQLHLNHHQSLNDKFFSFGLIRVGKIKHAVQFAKKYLNTNFSESKYLINNETIEIKFLIYHSNLLNSKRFIIEEFLDKTLNQNSKTISNPLVLDYVVNSKAKHVIFIVIATPVEEIGRDHDFHWSIIEPSSVQSIIQTAGRVNRHRKITVDNPNVSILQYNLSYYQQTNYNNIYFTKPGLETIENRYKQNIKDLLPWDKNGELYITSELRYKSKFAQLDDESISLSLNNLTFKFQNNLNHWFRLEYYLLNQLREKNSESFTYNVDDNEFYLKDTNGKKCNSELIDEYENKYNNALILCEKDFRNKIQTNLKLIEWANQSNISIYEDSQKSKLRYHNIFGFYFKN